MRWVPELYETKHPGQSGDRGEDEDDHNREHEDF